MTLIQLIVERGADAVQELPAGIASNPAAMAETIENNLRRVIIDEQPINPKYYETMSELAGHAHPGTQSAGASNTKPICKNWSSIDQEVANPAAEGGITYPKSLNTNARRALYDNLGHKCRHWRLHSIRPFMTTRQDDWRGNIIKEREVRYAIQRYSSMKGRSRAHFSNWSRTKTSIEMHQIEVNGLAGGCRSQGHQKPASGSVSAQRQGPRGRRLCAWTTKPCAWL